MTEQDPLEVSLEDTELLQEVELLTDLIVAATRADNRLEQPEIDEILDVHRCSRCVDHEPRTRPAPRTSC